MKKLTEEDFYSKYTMADVNSDAFISEDGQTGMLETYAPDIYKAVDYANDPKTTKCVWTMIDGDDGVYIVAGYRLVNRIYYIITNEPWEDESEEYLVHSYDEEEELSPQTELDYLEKIGEV